ncbi:unnamed protein product [Schistosoma rodhaini]|uniref:WW domain-containing protein n=1 Tax=Schistosoma rodhaini TaxID=6188 RepID=A0AA85FM81_9TREM|nr:unnamed protein product [Schistosoma rodhaini]
MNVTNLINITSIHQNYPSYHPQFICESTLQSKRFLSPQFHHNLNGRRIPITERRPVPWLLLSTNRLAIIRRLLGDSENFTSLNALPSGYRANICLTPFNNANINNLDILYHSRIALVCCNPSITSTSEPAQPMFIYSHGSAFTVEMTSSNVRVPPFLNFSELVNYVKKLPLLPCKDSPTLVPMHCLPDSFTFQPHSLLLVQHMKGNNWTEEISRSTGKLYYFNRLKSESTFDSPESEHLSFTETHFTKLPWITEQKYCSSVTTLIQYLEKMSDPYS